MSTQMVDPALRSAGISLVLGALLLLVCNLLGELVGSVGHADRATFTIVHLGSTVGAAAVLLGLPAIYLRQSRTAGPVALLGFALLFLGYLGFGFFVAAAATILLPWVYDQASCALGCQLLSTTGGPPLYPWFVYTEGLATFAGLILLGWSTARSGTFPAASGYLMAIAGVLAIPLLFVSLPAIFSDLPLILGAVALVWIGLTLISEVRR